MATSQYTDATQVIGTLKQVYADKIKDLRLKVAIIQEKCKFKSSELVADKYHQPVVVTHNHGWFYDTSGGSRTMPDNPTAMQTADLAVPAYEITERLRIPFGTIASLNAGNAASFFDTQVLKMLSLQKAMVRDVEWSSLYGQRACANVTASTSPSGGKIILTLDPVSIAEAFWGGMENAPLDLYDAANGTGNLQNTNAALVVTALASDFSTVTVSGNSTDLTTISGLSYGTFYLYKRSTVGFELPGIIAQQLNTGTLFGQNYSAYTLLLAIQQTGVGQPSMKKLLDGLAKAQARGLEDDIEIWTSPKGFNALMVDMSALSRIGGGDYNPGKLQNGAKAVEFFSQNGSCTVVSHAFMKNGDTIAIVPANIARIGAKDITDNLDGLDLSVMQGSNNAFEFRLFTNQAVVNIAPAQSVNYGGITFA